MKIYMEEGAWLSCSFDLATTPQQLQRHFSKEEDLKVQYSSGLRLLTHEDKVTEIKFECKVAGKLFGGLGALIGGIVAGVVGGIVIGALLVFGGPVGWAIVGTIAAGVVLGGVGGYAGTKIAKITHDCSDCQQDGKWQNTHKRVSIKKENPLLYNHSYLECGKKGGVLIASETEALAKEVSSKMSTNANWELGVQILSQSLQGIVIGYGAVDDIFTGDTDFVTIPIAITEYVVSDGVFYYYSPEQSLMLGAGFSGVSFIPGFPGGNEVTSVKDWITTLGALGIEYGSNKIEEALSNKNVSTNSDGSLGGIIGDTMKEGGKASPGKNIMANI